MRKVFFLLAIALLGCLIWFGSLQTTATSTEQTVPPRSTEAPLPRQVGVGDRSAVASDRVKLSSTLDIPPTRRMNFDFLRAPQLGLELAKGANSNDANTVGATLYAHLQYCSGVATFAPGMTAEAVANMMSTFHPSDVSGYVFSPKTERISEIEIARQRCFDDQNSLSQEAFKALRSRLFERTQDVGALLTKLQTVAPLDFSSLSAAERSLLSGDRLDVLSRLLINYGGRIELEGVNESGQQANSLYMKNLALCEMGADCERGSIEFSYVCANFGACSGNNVQEAIKNMMGSKNSDLYAQIVEKARDVAAKVPR